MTDQWAGQEVTDPEVVRQAHELLRQHETTAVPSVIARPATYTDGYAGTPADQPLVQVVGPEMVGRFGDQSHPPESVSGVTPEQEAHVVALMRGGATADQILAYGTQIGHPFDPASVQAAVARRAQDGQVAGYVDNRLPNYADIPQSERESTLGGEGGRATGRGIVDSIPGLGHVMAAVRAATADSPRSFGDEYRYQTDVDQTLTAHDEEAHPWLRLGGQLLGGAAIPMVGVEEAGANASARALASGATQAEARAVGFAAARNHLALNGAAYGAAHGGLNANSVGDAATGAVTEGALGAATPFAMQGAGRVASAAARRVLPAATPEGLQTAAAAGRLGMDVMPADVGSPAIGRLSSGAAQSAISAPAIVGGAQRVARQGAEQLDAVAQQAGVPVTQEAAGDLARQGALSFIPRTSDRIGRIYDRAGQLSNGVNIELPGAVAAADANLARLRAAPQTPDVVAATEQAQAIRSALDGSFGVQGVRDWRTMNFMPAQLRSPAAEAQQRAIVNAAADDVFNGLVSAGRPEAAAAFRRADNLWRQRIDVIDNVIRPIIGKEGNEYQVSGEQIVQRLHQQMQGNVGRFTTFLRTLTPEEAGPVRATLINRLGAARPAERDADTAPFSFATFLQNYRNMNDRTRAALFGAEGRAAINDLATVAEGTTNGQRFANFSNTGSSVMTLAGVGAAGGGVASAAATGNVLALIAPATVGLINYGGGRLLASPQFARWLARANRVPVQNAAAYVGRLSRIARAEPQIANEVIGLQQHLQGLLSGTPVNVAAAPEPMDGTGVIDGSGGQQQPQEQGVQP